MAVDQDLERGLFKCVFGGLVDVLGFRGWVGDFPRVADAGEGVGYCAEEGGYGEGEAEGEEALVGGPLS